MNILGIETSCDETSAAVVRDGHTVLSNIVYTQIAHHKPYGGVVPEIASRMHVEHLPGVIAEAISASGLSWPEIDAIAVTHGPGLTSSLLVGLSGAKGLALRLAKPLIGINHLEAHIYSIFLGHPEMPPASLCPFLALIVSGGHTCFIQVNSIGDYHQLGRTVDDAAGEAFDKGSNLLGLGYPGGPAIDKAARTGSLEFVTFPRGFVRKLHARTPDLIPKYCVSFSGLKTALLYHIKDHPLGSGPDADINNLAASYQEAIVDTLVQRSSHAAESAQTMAVVGGVSLNKRLREKLGVMADKKRIRLVLADSRYCTDNAAMVAGLAFHKLEATRPLGEAMELDADPNLGIGIK
ncbi:MAG: tRNA (adenosine(37)-N6)-threonylcarbamoyltransferase complex transferase subunit TsaD [bacterium]